MKKQIIVFLIPVVFIFGCKTTKKTSTDNVTNLELVAPESFRKPLVDKELFKTTTEAVLIDTLYLTKDTLNIFTKKVTGCDADNFKLIWNGDLGKTLPAQANLKLFQLVDAACQERHRFHLTFNVSSLKLKSDTSSTKVTLIKLGGWSKTANYNHN